VLEPYASDRELVLLPFGVLIAAFGAELLLARRAGWVRAGAIGLLALVPQHFLFFEFDYFGDYHRRSAFWFDWNHRGGLEAIISLDARGDRPIVLSNGDDSMMAAFWRFEVLKYHRADLLPLTRYVDARTLDFSTVAPRALILMNRNDAPLVGLIASRQLRQLAEIPEPAEPPYYIVAER
jgi:hypothetical protein